MSATPITGTRRDGTMFLGPAVMEWGWELMCWNPIARRLAQQHRAAGGGPVHVAAPATSRYLYEFADEFFPVGVVPGTAEGLSGQLAGVAAPLACESLRVEPSEQEHGDPDRAAFRSPDTRADATRKLWRTLGVDGDRLHDADVCVAFRPPKEFRGKVYPEKAWPEGQCAELVAALQGAGFRVAAIGGRDNYAAGVASELDLRGMPLKVQAAAVAWSLVTVGPSSAPLHLASLCCTPHVTWYGRAGSQNVSSRNRYAGAWNPFRTPHAFLEPLCPSVQEVFDSCRRMIECA